MNYMLVFLIGCIVLGLWGPKNIRWLHWLAPIGAVLLIVFFLVTHLNHI
jgi:peptidoglycan/LPS O-acetylase OafA/YrhL